jgi:hypothetical protein
VLNENELLIGRKEEEENEFYTETSHIPGIKSDRSIQIDGIQIQGILKHFTANLRILEK